MLGFLNLDKPPGWTSHDCVAKVRSILKTKRVGHGGTLDPMATGVLPIAVGQATRLLPYLPENKAYRASIKFGVTTTTDDVEGEIITSSPCHDLRLEEVAPYLQHFLGKIEQIPPMYSAIQVNGQRLYKLARQSQTIDVPSREVEIYRIQVLGWQEGEFPLLEVSIACGSGTYIRSIARDLGKMLHRGATLASLSRTSSCGMELDGSVTLDRLSEAKNSALIPPSAVLAYLKSLILSDQEVKKWLQGQKLSLSSGETPDSFVGVYSEAEQFLGIGTVQINEDSYELRPKVVLA
ncbi:MAG: tRNA pseudouridine synthase B [Chroococcopsis gigantea SAG 12.99]|jgi:tRNA pseudouridine55 synthase|nr:tRNA pseudouridine(55) synthase TruB [Chlorogloea purpurea SAG 13.99]MDV2998452.1 tRNA pseudouridine synthase B [Chroococcopsis gigantea SAG 12.99]